MYSSLGLHKNARRKYPNELIGTHQELDRIARKTLQKHLKRGQFFPSTKEILHFEGMRGPDGLKTKSPGEDEPCHFITDDDHHLLQLIADHRHNLHQALVKHNRERAAFEAAWLAHALTDGLTPAHHVPLEDLKKDLMNDNELFKIFGTPVKGLIRGDTAWQTLKGNWKYWGVNGYMSRHVAFEYLVVLVLATPRKAFLNPKLTASDFTNLDFDAEFMKSLEKIRSLRLYERFGSDGITSNLAREIRHLLLPEIIRIIVLGWYSCL